MSFSPTISSRTRLFNLQKGFTLLELLVVISIIAILIAASTASFSTAQKKARDAKRKGDLKALSNALEQYYSVATEYVASCTPTATYLPGGMPTDPKTGLAYTTGDATEDATFSCSTTAYCICDVMETGAGGNSGGGADATCSNIGSGATQFCIKNLQ